MFFQNLVNGGWFSIKLPLVIHFVNNHKMINFLQQLEKYL